MLILFALEIKADFLDVGLILCFIRTHKLIFSYSLSVNNREGRGLHAKNQHPGSIFRLYIKFVWFRFKIEDDQICSGCHFSKNLKRYWKIDFLGGTKVFNLKTHERKLHFLHSYRNEKQLSAACVSETHRQAY